MGLLDNVSKEINRRNKVSVSIASFMKEMSEQPILESILGDTPIDEIAETELDQGDIEYLESIGEDDSDEEYGFENEDGSEATEGYNTTIARSIRDDRVKEARELLKEAKKLKRKKEYIEAIGKLKKSRALIVEMKNVVDKMDEPESGWKKFSSWFTPIFTLLPSARLSGVNVVPVFRDGAMSFDIVYTYEKFSDSMSINTGNAVKQQLQYKFNLFIHNLDITLKLYEQLSVKDKAKAGAAVESFYSWDATNLERELLAIGYESVVFESGGTIEEKDEYPEEESDKEEGDAETILDGEISENSNSILASMKDYLEDEAPVDDVVEDSE